MQLPASKGSKREPSFHAFGHAVLASGVDETSCLPAHASLQLYVQRRKDPLDQMVESCPTIYIYVYKQDSMKS